MQQREGVGAASHQHALGQFEHQPIGVQLGLIEHTLHDLGEVAIDHLAGRQVHRDRDRLLTRRHRPVDRISDRSGEHPLADFDDDSRLLGQRNELSWRHHAAVRVVPAHQRFGPDDLLRAQLHDRLIHHRQFATIHCLAQIGLQLDAVQHGRMHAAFVQHGARLAARLGMIHRDVGVAQHLVRSLAGLRARNADRCVQIGVLALHLQRT